MENQRAFSRILVAFLVVQGIMACSEQCSLCIGATNTCYACRDPSLQPLENGECSRVAPVQGCLYYSLGSACKQCSLGYRLEGSACVKDSTGCLTFNADNNCGKCGFGTRLQAGKCVGILNCQTYDSSLNYCQSCLDGFQTFPHLCYPKEGCAQASQLGGCLACSPGFRLSGFQCVSNSLKVDGCAVISANGKCLYCEEGFIESNGVCLAPLMQFTSVPVSFSSGGTTYSSSLQKVSVSDSFTPPTQSTSFNSAPSINNLQSVGEPGTISNCKAFADPSNKTCRSCQYRFLLKNNVCEPVPEECVPYNMQNGDCLGCLQGYILTDNFQCKKQVTQNTLPEGCEKSSNTGGCSKCLYGWMLKNSNCEAVSKLCDGYNLSNGKCLGCVAGYDLNNGDCIPKANQPQLPSPPLQSTPTPAQQPQFFGPFAPQQPPTPPAQPSMPQPQFFSPQPSPAAQQPPQQLPPVQQQTQFFQPNPMPVQSQPQPQPFTPVQQPPTSQQPQTRVFPSVPAQNSFAANVQTLTRNLQPQPQPAASTPTFTPSAAPQSTQGDPNCKVWNGGVCQECYAGSYLDMLTYKCLLNDPFCKSPGINGICRDCYQGYQLINNKCVVQTRPTERNCRQWDGSFCRACSQGFRLVNGTCRIINQLCKGVNQDTGECTACYDGYTLSNGNCGVRSSDRNCRGFTNGICSECSQGFYLNNNGNNGVCTAISSLCKTYNNATGACLSCYPGYELQGSSCVISRSDRNCKTKGQNGGCLECFAGYGIKNGKCENLDPNCKTYTFQQTCGSCYSGYTLASGRCILDPNDANSLCRTRDPTNGLCLTCYGGYRLVNGNCIVPQNQDPYCIQKSGSTCLACADRYYLNQGVCTIVDSSCWQYVMVGGACISCQNGFRLVDGKCVQALSSDPNCETADFNSICTRCRFGFGLKNNRCESINILCADFDYNTNRCSACQEGNVLQDGDCIYPALGVDPFCTRYLNGFCTACRSNYRLKDYKCHQ